LPMFFDIPKLKARPSLSLKITANRKVPSALLQMLDL
jgi:hypothetical protein